MIARPKLVEPRNIFRQVDAGQAEAEVVSIASVPVLPAAKARPMQIGRAHV